MIFSLSESISFAKLSSKVYQQMRDQITLKLCSFFPRKRCVVDIENSIIDMVLLLVFFSTKIRKVNKVIKNY